MSHKILITDDAIIIREMIKDTVTAAGWTVVGQASNGKMAVDLYREHRPDVMTLDMVMPEYDGLYALREIMALDPQAKVLVVSALDQSKILKEAFVLGATDFIIKPFKQQALLEALERLVSAVPQTA
jgi:two-component system, chemotaxis family, chemotaxis protein CheY